MKNKIVRLVWVVIPLVLFGIVEVQESFAQDMSTNNIGTLSLSHIPKVGDTVELTFRLTASEFPRQQFGGEILLFRNSAFTLEKGDLEKFETWDSQKVFEISVTIKAVKEGSWAITAIDDRGEEYLLLVTVEKQDVSETTIKSSPELSSEKISPDLKYHLRNEIKNFEVLFQVEEIDLNYNNIMARERLKLHTNQTDSRNLERANIIEFIQNNNGTIIGYKSSTIIANLSDELIVQLSKNEQINTIECNYPLNCGIEFDYENEVIPEDVGHREKVAGRITESGCNAIDGKIVKNIIENDTRKSLCKYGDDYYLFYTWKECIVKKSILINKDNGEVFQFDTLCDFPHTLQEKWIPFKLKPQIHKNEFLFSYNSICKDTLIPLLRDHEIICIKPTSISRFVDNEIGIPLKSNQNLPLALIAPDPFVDSNFIEPLEQNFLVQTLEGIITIPYTISHGKIVDIKANGSIDIKIEHNLNSHVSLAIPKLFVDNWNESVVIGNESELEFEEFDIFTHRIISIDIPYHESHLSIIPIVADIPDVYKISFGEEIQIPFPDDIDQRHSGFFSCVNSEYIPNKQKFQKGLLDKINVQLKTKNDYYDSLVLVVKDKDKEFLSQVLNVCHQAKNVDDHSLQNGIIVDVPVTEISNLSFYDEIFNIEEKR